VIDVELLRGDQQILKNAAKRRNQNIPIEKAYSLDIKRRNTIVELDDLRSRRNETSKIIGVSKEKSPKLISEMKKVGSSIKELEIQLKILTEELNKILMNIPNIPADSAPDGKGEKENVEIRIVGEKPKLNFKLKPHWELGEDLGIIDLERGVKLAHTRFYVLKGKGATLQRAIIAWMLNFHINNHTYQELYLPYMVNRETVTASSHLPHFEENMYHDAEDDLFMVPTAEAPVTGLFRDEIIDEGELPMRFVSHTPCWRREKFSAGRDTRGIKRVHQFYKVEMFKYVEPETSMYQLEKMVNNARVLCDRLELSSKLIQLSTGDIGFQSAITFDIEVWASGSKEWLEVSSISNCMDFQSRRNNTRFKGTQSSSTTFPHTLNGSGLALPRIWVAIIENGQQEDGSINIPEVLVPYTGFKTI